MVTMHISTAQQQRRQGPSRQATMHHSLRLRLLYAFLSCILLLKCSTDTVSCMNCSYRFRQSPQMRLHRRPRCCEICASASAWPRYGPCQ